MVSRYSFQLSSNARKPDSLSLLTCNFYFSRLLEAHAPSKLSDIAKHFFISLIYTNIVLDDENMMLDDEDIENEFWLKLHDDFEFDFPYLPVWNEMIDAIVEGTLIGNPEKEDIAIAINTFSCDEKNLEFKRYIENQRSQDQLLQLQYQQQGKALDLPLCQQRLAIFDEVIDGISCNTIDPLDMTM